MTMTQVNKIIIGFQKLKHNYIKEIAKKKNVKIPPYHTIKDTRAIESWGKTKAKYVLNRLIPDTTLGSYNCAFCIKRTDSCGSCEYAKNRKGIICSHESSDFRYLKREVMLNFTETECEQFYKLQEDYLEKHRKTLKTK